MESTVYNPPEADLQLESRHQNVSLWNPDAAGAWSILFSPIFGSILVRSNWRELGDEGKARSGTIWIWSSVFMLVLSAVIPFVSLPFLIVWYFTYQRKQTNYVKQNLGAYSKKSWLKPLAIATVAYIVAFVIAVVFVTILTGQM